MGGLNPRCVRLIQDALHEKLQRIRRVRLARECAKLDKVVEQRAAEEHFSGEVEWLEQ